MGLEPDIGILLSIAYRFLFVHSKTCCWYCTYDSLYNDNEETVGKWFKRTGKRDEIFLATKFGFVKGKFPELDSTGEYAKKACEESLRILGVEYIDLCMSTKTFDVQQNWLSI